MFDAFDFTVFRLIMHSFAMNFGGSMTPDRGKDLVAYVVVA